MTQASASGAPEWSRDTRSILLSPPDVGPLEREFVLDALDSGWVAPAGPHLAEFEQEIAAVTGVAHGVAVASGTAALHLALRLAGVGPGDHVAVATLTFIASAAPVVQLGATPIFVESDATSWTLDPEALDLLLARATEEGWLPRAVIAVDLYGQCANYDRLRATCQRHGVVLIEDAAEALGATVGGRPAGGLGDMGVLSFNGNKTITTSGGGMLLLDDPALAERARFLATQAREPAPHYEHHELGYNYRMSNLLAALGRAQLRSLDWRVARRRAIFRTYVDELGGIPGLDFMPEAPWGCSSRWLTTLTVDEGTFGATRDAVCDHLAGLGIEARPVWKPMHLQPVFAGTRVAGRGAAVSEDLFRAGICLPSGSSLDEEQLARVIAGVRATPRAWRRAI